ncbi:MAG TPA: HD domain-containing protein [Bryobacteraceae bacterium]|nr:HD domain-containing protein [Bryobacteraceae bacterium]
MHGFVRLNDWEMAIVSEPAFQRLRRIKQLAWTDYIYPGAVHTRFEHSLGVMHTATMLYDAIVRNSKDILTTELAYDDTGIQRYRQLVRLAALTHDVGHAPFSHAAEDLFPINEDTQDLYRHEDYSAAIVKSCLRSAIEDHPLANNYGFTAEDVAALIEGTARAKQGLFWRDIISGQMDADRMDYLLRDSHHTGVQYGRFDLDRVIDTMQATPALPERPPRLGISEGGWHAAEALVIARYFMFTQVYFHKTRVAYDIHLKGALKQILPGGVFPKPREQELKDFLSWDDWRVLGELSAGRGGEHGERLRTRNHFRRIYATNEICNEGDLSELDRVKNELGGLIIAEESAAKSWYKTGTPDIAVVQEESGRIRPLSQYSNVIANLRSNNQVLLYVKPEHVAAGRKSVEEAVKKHD